MNFVSQLFAFLYVSRQRRFLGFRVAMLLRLLPFALLLYGSLAGWPAVVEVILAGAGLLLLLTYFLAGRVGYKRFVADSAMALDEAFAAPQVEQRIPLRATGVFGLANREAYILERPAEYWRVPRGQHVLMAQEQPGSFLYQIIEPELVEAVEAGYLLFGRQPQKALAVRFWVTWGPGLDDEPEYRYGEEGAPTKRQALRNERTIYFTFDHDADRHAVWRSFTIPSGQRPE